MDIARFIHVIGSVVWVGGMFFAYVALRPAAGHLQPPERLRLWRTTFQHFFRWVWASVVGVLASGLWLVGLMGGFAAVSVHVHIMFAIGVFMIAIFLHVFFSPYRRLGRCVDAQEWPAAGVALGQIRRLVAFNLVLGVLAVAMGTGGRLLA